MIKDFNFYCVIDIYTKYVRDESIRIPNKIWVKKGSKFYNKSTKSLLQNNDTETHSAHNEGKSIAAGIFIRILKNKIYKYMTSISKNVYIDKLYNIVNEYNNTYHRTIKKNEAC